MQAGKTPSLSKLSRSTFACTPVPAAAEASEQHERAILEDIQTQCRRNNILSMLPGQQRQHMPCRLVFYYAHAGGTTDTHNTCPFVYTLLFLCTACLCPGPLPTPYTQHLLPAAAAHTHTHTWTFTLPLPHVTDIPQGIVTHHTFGTTRTHDAANATLCMAYRLARWW